MTSIGVPQRIHEIEPVVIPVPTPEPATPEPTFEPEREPVEVPRRRKEDDA